MALVNLKLTRSRSSLGAMPAILGCLSLSSSFCSAEKSLHTQAPARRELRTGNRLIMVEPRSVRERNNSRSAQSNRADHETAEFLDFRQRRRECPARRRGSWDQMSCRADDIPEMKEGQRSASEFSGFLLAITASNCPRRSTSVELARAAPKRKRTVLSDGPVSYEHVKSGY